MAARIRKILYTTDLSENSAYVFNYALNSAEMHNAKIDIFHVMKPILVVPGVSDGIDADVNQLLAVIKKRMDDLLQKDKKYNPERAGLVASIEVVEGEPVKGILQKANADHPDIIIMGKHNRGFFAQTFRGSVAMSVLHQTKIPVYIIPIPDR